MKLSFESFEMSVFGSGYDNEIGMLVWKGKIYRYAVPLTLEKKNEYLFILYVYFMF